MYEVILKLLHAGETRRVCVTAWEQLDYRALISRVNRVLLCSARDRRLEWFDGEDWIALSEERDWLEARAWVMRCATHKLRVRVLDACTAASRASFSRVGASGVYKRLSLDVSSMRDVYDVLVVGSGYGGSITACRMARTGKSVCLLERGQELLPGEYPNSLQTVLPQVRLTLPDGSTYGPRTGFIDWTISQNLFIWKGCGLGGGSLVNSNVSIKPDPRVYESWPKAFQQEPQLLEDGFKRAAAMLCPNPYPDQSTTPLGKISSLQRASQGNGGSFYLADVNVTFRDRVNEQGVFQQACKLCGDCNTGCNYGSKNTLLMNYLPDAKKHGAEIFSNTQVEWLERQQDGSWIVHCQLLPSPSCPMVTVDFTVQASVVVLAAGSIGSTEILLRSKEKGLALSSQVGNNFGVDGDFWGVSYNAATAACDIGYGNQYVREILGILLTAPSSADEMRAKEGPVGPCICSVWDLRDAADPLQNGVVIEDMAFPGALAPIANMLLPIGESVCGQNTAPLDRISQLMRILQSATEGPYFGATRNTMLMGGMGWDTQSGKILLNPQTDGVCFNWKDPIDPVQNARRNALLLSGCTNLQSTFIKDLFVTPLVPNAPIVQGGVHPIGGCVMADTAEKGVVNDRGQVFNSVAGASVYDSLYVADGAIIPNAVGVNTLFTISAVAERINFLLARERNWSMSQWEGPSLNW